MNARTDYTQEIRALNKKGGGGTTRPPVVIKPLDLLTAVLARLAHINRDLNLPQLTEEERASGNTSRTTELLAQPPVYRRLLVARQDLVTRSAVTPDVLTETIVDSDRATQLRSAAELVLWCLLEQFYAVDAELENKNSQVRAWRAAAEKGQTPGVSPTATYALFSRQGEVDARATRLAGARGSKKDKAEAAKQQAAQEAEAQKRKLRARDALLSSANQGEPPPPKGTRKKGGA